MGMMWLLLGGCQNHRVATDVSASTKDADFRLDESALEEARYWASCDALDLGLEAFALGDWDTAQGHFDEALCLALACSQSERGRTHVDHVVQTIYSLGAQGLVEPAETVHYDTATLEKLLDGALTDTEIETMDEPAEALPEKTSYDVPMVNNRAVESFLRVFTEERADVIRAALERSLQYVPMIRRVFEEHGLPGDLCFLPLIESGYKTHARSRVRATGMWQFMAGTGRDYGLRVDFYEDQRLDPEYSTHAAARYLKALYDRFGDWYLALAAYNSGPGRVNSAIRRGRSRDFWTLARKRKLPRETIGYVPAFLAGLRIAKEPEKHGFVDLQPATCLSYDTVKLEFCIDLGVLAESMGLDRQVLKTLNPALIRGMTPPGREAYSLRVPEGTGESARLALAQIPEDQRLRLDQHRVRKGETLSHIARRYGVSIKVIQDVNRIPNPRRLQIGDTLLIPLSGYAGGYTAPSSASGASRHRIRRGDTLYEIARAHGTSISNLLRLNPGVDPLALRPGAVIHITPGKAMASSPSGAEDRDYVVVRGDTLSGIAKCFDVPLSHLLQVNGLTRRSTIWEGQVLQLPENAAPRKSATYRVKQGDTVSRIAERFRVSVRDIVAWNRLSSAHQIRVGDTLLIYFDGT